MPYNLKKFFGIKSFNKYGLQPNNYDILKFLAITTMIIGHIGYFFLTELHFLRGIGRLAFPVFFFLVGYSLYFKPSYNLLIIGVALTLLNFFLLGASLQLNILVSAFIVRILIGFLEEKDMLHGFNLFGIFLAALIIHFPIWLALSYGSLGLLFAICGYLFRHNRNRQVNIKSANITPINITFLIATILANFFIQSFGFGVNSQIFTIILIIVSICLFLLFIFFEKIKLVTGIKMADYTIMWVSRNALFVYVAHVTAFILIKAALM